jgi:predicted kinase
MSTIGSQNAVIFDIDGTLADATHRLHWVTGGKRDWPAFFAAMNRDTVVKPIRALLWSLQRDNKIVLCSGRPEDYRETIEIWLSQNHIINTAALYMRAAGDYRSDHIVKAELLTKMREDGYEPWLAVDDRSSIVAMWREHGITCLQCRDWNESPNVAPGLLTIMVGPSGAGKTTWLTSAHADDLGIRPEQIVSSDRLRAEFCGDFRSQERNDEVFATLHAIVKARVASGLPTVVDATNLRTKDRKAVAMLTSGAVRYIVIDRSIEQKRRDAGWRAELKGADGQPFDLIAKHDQTFRSNLKDILAGDALPNVEVLDLR